MLSFDCSSLFTNLPLDFTISMLLDKIYRDKEISTKFKREELRRLLCMCTNEGHFSSNGLIYQQTDGIAIGSPLGPVIYQQTDGIAIGSPLGPVIYQQTDGIAIGSPLGPVIYQQTDGIAIGESFRSRHLSTDRWNSNRESFRSRFSEYVYGSIRG